MTDSDALMKLRIPLRGGKEITVEGDFPVTDQDWELFMHILNVMRPGLVSDLHALAKGIR